MRSSHKQSDPITRFKASDGVESQVIDIGHRIRLHDGNKLWVNMLLHLMKLNLLRI